MQTILIGYAARSLGRELADHDAHQLRDIGLTRAADGTLRLQEDPSVEVAPPAHRVESGVTWIHALLGFWRPSRALKTSR